jgi:integrase
MSSVTKVPTGWRARWRTPDGKSRSKTFARKIDAEKHLTATDHAKLTGADVDPGAGRITFRCYGEQWRAVQVHRPSTAVQLETNLRRHVYPTLGDRPMGAIRPSEVQAWVRSLAEVLEPSTVELVYRYVVAIFRAATADRVISQNPVVGTRLPKAEPRRVEPLGAEVVQAIMEAVPDRYRALVVLAAGTGLRQGECFGLTLDRVDFLRRQLTVDRQLVLLPGSGPALGAPKTQASYRVVPLPAVVLDALAAHLSCYPVGPDGFLFTNHAGEPIRRTRFSDVWRPAVKASGAPMGTGFHSLRHFYASLLIRHGESVKVVQARLGHASAAETLDTYSHLWPDSEDRTRAAVDEVLGPRVSPACHAEEAGT